MDGRETNAEQRRFITDTESTNSHESPCADLRWSESLSHPLCIATGRELTIRDSDVAATDLALEKGDDLVNGQLVPDFPMNFYQHLLGRLAPQTAPKARLGPVLHEKAMFVNEVGPLRRAATGPGCRAEHAWAAPTF